MKLIRLIVAIITAIVSALSAANSPSDMPNPDSVKLGDYAIAFDDEGRYSVSKNNTLYFQNAYSEFKWHGETVQSTDYSNFSVSKQDGALTLTMQSDTLPQAEQTFALSDDGAYLKTRLTVRAGETFSTNYIAPLVTGQKSVQTSAQNITAVLEIPFDNDGWKEFARKTLSQDTVSYEAGLLFNPSGGGIVLGSLEHDLWKSAVTTDGGVGGIDALKLYCGATDPYSGDAPHGDVSGTTVSSPLMFIGVFDDWQSGLEQFAQANVDVQPKRASVTDDVPIGWNSWGSVQQDLNYETAVGISDYVKDNFQSVWQADGSAVYINLDSYWDMLSDDELAAFVEHCHANGQKAGIYSAPFVMWYQPDEMDSVFVPGTNNTVTYQDITLKKPDGTYYGNEVDGCIPLDVTNPATKLHVQTQFDRFKKAGFDYIKLDFLVHASFEGDFYDESITTGIQAYNYAMQYATEMLGDDMFINLAMSPIFPYQYANGRRLACDAYYSMDETEYTLNAVTYGFWENILYDYTDPDHIVVWGRDGKATPGEAICRATSGVISGTSFLAGDNFYDPAGIESLAKRRFDQLLANPDVIHVAKIDKIFKPDLSGCLPRAASVYRMQDGGKEYIAVFNFSILPAEHTISLGDAQTYTVKELWSGDTFESGSEMTVKARARYASLYEVTPKQ